MARWSHWGIGCWQLEPDVQVFADNKAQIIFICSVSVAPLYVLYTRILYIHASLRWDNLISHFLHSFTPPGWPSGEWSAVVYFQCAIKWDEQNALLHTGERCGIERFAFFLEIISNQRKESLSAVKLLLFWVLSSCSWIKSIGDATLLVYI